MDFQRFSPPMMAATDDRVVLDLRNQKYENLALQNPQDEMDTDQFNMQLNNPGDQPNPERDLNFIAFDNYQFQEHFNGTAVQTYFHINENADMITQDTNQDNAL
ncbi:UNKNOWN [Stylonychia lemnae]|uniref:Uncharacterized protein n=1 Tax=Stylonychia lemnae TaxID=5949 RepID=A0A077ZYN8_STYLE|nr:UNKNOWN [Stylonychia lemnae]|eukprot:CDW73646.1 UNKNOWN [Stylonychia lemnae]